MSALDKSEMSSSWGSFLAAGVALTAGELGLTLLLASLFVGGGLFRAIAEAAVRFPLWEWTVASGVISVVLGFVLLVPLPVASSWFIGFVVGLELPLEGAAVSAVERA